MNVYEHKERKDDSFVSIWGKVKTVETQDWKIGPQKAWKHLLPISFLPTVFSISCLFSSYFTCYSHVETRE